jgi:hypothetical protein
MTKELRPLSKQPAIISSYCRFNNHPVYQDPDTGKKFIGSWKPPYIPYKSSDKSVVVSTGNAYRPDIISYNYYTTPLLGWLICYVNGIDNPYDKTTGLYPGRLLRIPDITTITAALTF